MTDIRRVSIFVPRATHFFRALLVQLKRGFQAAGIEASGAPRHLDADEMRAWCTKERPQVVFEIDRSRRAAPFVPDDVRHVVWVVEPGARGLDEFTGSDITYLFAPKWVQHFASQGHARWLPPGACEEDYAAEQRPLAQDVSFAGDIPNPWVPSELDRDLTGGAADFRFGDILPLFESELRRSGTAGRSPQEGLEIAGRLCQQTFGVPLQINDDKLRSDLSSRVLLHLNRCDLIDRTLKHTKSLALFGSSNWKRWPAYAPYYRGELHKAAALREVYQSSAANLHEGPGIHFSCLNIMCAGGLLLFRRSSEARDEGGMATLFQPGAHYVEFDRANLGDQLRWITRDLVRAQRIRDSAAEFVRAEHTWRERARAIVADFKQWL